MGCLYALVGLLEAGCGILQVTAQVFAGSDNTLCCGTPVLVHLLVTLAAHTLPITLDLTRDILDLRLDAVIDLLVQLNENLSKLAQKVCINMNCAHEYFSSICFVLGTAFFPVPHNYFLLADLHAQASGK